MSLSKLLMVNGQSASAAPPDLYQANVAVLMNMDSLPFTEANGKEVVSSIVALGEPLYGGEGSALFSGNGIGYMKLLDPSNIIHEYVTFECTFEKTATGSMGLMSSLKLDGDPGSWYIEVSDTSVGICFLDYGGMAYFNASLPITLNERHTVSFSIRFGVYQRCYIAVDGVQRAGSFYGAMYNTSPDLYANRHSMYIGSIYGKHSFFKGRIDALRITQGVARYQTNYVIDYNQPYSLE